jgi:hypothetical protein
VPDFNVLKRHVKHIYDKAKSNGAGENASTLKHLDGFAVSVTTVDG